MAPEITIIVPYHNEKETIEYTLERAGGQSLPAKCAIFVNSSSTDNSFNVVNDWIQKNQRRFCTQFKNVFENTSNPGSSKNVGVRLADTEWVAFMDCGQNFEADWLEKQFQFSKKNKLDVVSGVVYLVGENWVDRCAVAQTYGYKKNRPCIPTTLVKKSVFEKTGLFLEGRRAAYDVAWPGKLKKLGVPRGINEEVKIFYIGTNFSSSLGHLFRKSVLYATSGVAIEGYFIPYLYIVFPPLVLTCIFISYKLALALIIFYCLARSFFLPVMKSRNFSFYKEHPFESMLGVGLVGLIIDLGKIVGTAKGIQQYFFSGQ